jgi:hypothetical protein
VTATRASNGALVNIHIAYDNMGDSINSENFGFCAADGDGYEQTILV